MKFTVLEVVVFSKLNYPVLFVMLKFPLPPATLSSLEEFPCCPILIVPGYATPVVLLVSYIYELAPSGLWNNVVSANCVVVPNDTYGLLFYVINPFDIFKSPYIWVSPFTLRV
mgnify:CR=1 FL=1